MSTVFSTTVDIRRVATIARGPLVLAAFEALPTGAALELVHDHDPAPVRAALERRAPGLFAWEALENGPALWRASIRRVVGHTACCGSCG